MSETGNKIGKVFLFFLVFFMLVWYGSRIVEPKDNLDQYGMKDVSANGILSEGKDSIDVLFLGDSLVYSSISPMEMYEKEGFTSYLCSTPAQPLYYTKSLLERTLQNQSPKLVVLEADTFFRDFLATDPAVEKIKELFPLFEYHDRWKNLQAQDWTGDVHYTYNNVLKGFRIHREIKPVEKIGSYMDDHKKGENISILNRWVMDSIVQMCREKDCQVLVFSAPSYKNWNWKRHDAVQNYCDENHIPYLDLNTETKSLSIDWKEDTRDQGDHLNFKGAMKVTKYMESYLKQNYDLQDHRQDEHYQSWNDSLENYKKTIEGKK